MEPKLQNKFKVQVLNPCTCNNMRYPVYVTKRYRGKNKYGTVTSEKSTYRVWCPRCNKFTAEWNTRDMARKAWNADEVFFSTMVGKFDTAPVEVKDAEVACETR